MISALLTAIVHHADRIPERAARWAFTRAADFVWLLHLGSVSQLERNLRHVMGPVSHKRLRQVSREGLRSYFAYFCEALTVGGRSQEELLARIRTEGTGFPEPSLSNIKDASLPIAMGHQGNWDYAGFWAGQALGPVTTVAERLADPQLLEDFAQIRRGLGMHILLTGQPGLTQTLTQQVLQEGQVVPLLADRDLSRNGVFVRAFDSYIRVAAGPAVIALDAKLPLYTVNMHRESLATDKRSQAHCDSGYVCSIDGPIDIERYLAMPRQQAVQELTQAWVDQWAEGIRKFPQDWHMMQPIFIEDLDLNRLHQVPDNLRQLMEERAASTTARNQHE
ncbi:lipid A biosynthesis lauroyl acyltransferase [Bombiscardovia apis]|uniref:Lipid A biosynthesis lauroyl acyltransferase n=1 Tax=Bombiscardovia apis TaxID=2932182 RepID=A0ABN6SF99_9BIFI|nr:phosphatidylinositol mannoside acyltransferase [Bombiscardovia apis]BDR54689.1 lipid A biosynthesis lauroyl acyltransferase [Bombiscardovia apis]